MDGHRRQYAVAHGQHHHEKWASGRHATHYHNCTFSCQSKKCTCVEIVMSAQFVHVNRNSKATGMSSDMERFWHHAFAHATLLRKLMVTFMCLPRCGRWRWAVIPPEPGSLNLQIGLVGVACLGLHREWTMRGRGSRCWGDNHAVFRAILFQTMISFGQSQCGLVP